ncbi:succinate dehydrogenase assembly factor 2 [Methylocapsa acidiphila]|uniref:FAD assembly factor SdhE n=1 Tax=Methylocapsa acidiphila TaxID=133552 RepID=UPI000426BE02|nr:succinate dehydrogenase assembly factor 2 [Methylocapsa acidiphila]
MSGSLTTGAPLDARRRRIVFRAHHRGMLEMDIIFGRFVDAEIAALDDGELDDLEVLLDEPDRDVLSWVTGEEKTPARHDTPVFQKILRFHTHVRPLHE